MHFKLANKSALAGLMAPGETSFWAYTQESWASHKIPCMIVI